MPLRKLPPHAWIAALFLASPLAFAQSHDHAAAGGPAILVLHDGPDSGRAVVGNLAHFGFALVDDTGAPVRHEDAGFVLEQNGIVLLATNDTHEYDGIFSLDYTFRAAGPYVVRAFWSGAEGSGGVAEWTGVAVLSPAAARPDLGLTIATGPPVGKAAEISLEALAAGERIHHSDGLVEIRRKADDRVVLRAHGHTHEDPQVFRFSFPTPGEYELRATVFNAFPSREARDFLAASTVVPIQAGAPGRASMAGAAMLDVAVPPPPGVGPARAAPVKPENASGGLHLFPALDPTYVTSAREHVYGPETTIRLGALVVDAAARAAVAHVDFSARVTDAAGGIVYESSAHHEYDGHYELLLSALAPGRYSFALAAERGDWTDAFEVPFHVVPGGLPLSAGPYTVRFEPPAQASAWTPVPLAFRVENALGMPHAHSEIEIEVRAAGEDVTPLALWKVHTHDSGAFSTTFAFPGEGRYVLRVNPTTLEPRPTVTMGDGGPGAPISFDLEVGPGSPPEAVAPTESAAPGEPPARRIPVGLFLAVVGAAMASLALRQGGGGRSG